MSVNNAIQISMGNDPPITLTPYGRSYDFRYDKISREEQAADGTLREDVRAIKRVHILKYSLAEIDTVEALEMALMYGQPLTLLVEPAGGGTYKEYKVLLRPFGYKRVLSHGTWLYGDLTAEFMEV